MDNKEIIIIEDRRCVKSSAIVEFVTPDDCMAYDSEIVTAGAKKFADVLYKHVTSAFCDALAKELRDRG